LRDREKAEQDGGYRQQDPEFDACAQTDDRPGQEGQGRDTLGHGDRADCGGVGTAAQPPQRDGRFDGLLLDRLVSTGPARADTAANAFADLLK
jgi:hypothetical protein